MLFKKKFCEKRKDFEIGKRKEKKVKESPNIDITIRSEKKKEKKKKPFYTPIQLLLLPKHTKVGKQNKQKQPKTKTKQSTRNEQIEIETRPSLFRSLEIRMEDNPILHYLTTTIIILMILLTLSLRGRR